MRYFDDPLAAPAEYQTAFLPKEDIFLEIPKNAFRRLRDHIYHNILSPDSTDKPNDVWRTLVFSLIVDGYFCNSQGFVAISMLRVGDVLPALVKSPYVWMPRVNASIQDSVPPIVSFSILRALLVLREQHNFKEVRDIPASYSIVPSLSNAQCLPTKKEVRDLKSSFARWLNKQVKESKCGYPIRMRHLFAYGAKRANEYSNYVAGYLLGNHVINSVQPAQRGLLESLRSNYGENGNSRIEKSAHFKRKNRVHHFAHSEYENLNHIEKTVREIISCIRALDSLKIPSDLSKELKTRLSRCRDLCLASLGTGCQTVEEAYQALNGKDDDERVGYFNFAIISGWMKSLLTERKNTFLAYASDILLLVNENEGIPLNELSEDDITESLREHSERTRCRKISAINHLHDYLKSETKIPVAFPFMAATISLEIRPAYGLTTEQVRAVIFKLEDNGEDGRAAAISVLLGAYWGLRISETIKLLIDQIDLYTSITIHIRETKRAPLRDVIGESVPDWVVNKLSTYIEQKKKESKNRSSSRLLSVNSTALSERRIRYLIEKTLGSLKIPGSHHSFRHYWVNRLLALGYSLPEIADLAHHWSADTTVSTYSHIAPLLQQEQLAKQLQKARDAGDCDDQFLRISKIGLLLGKSDRAVQPAHLAAAGYTTYTRSPDGMYTPATLGNFVAIEDAIQYILGEVW